MEQATTPYKRANVSKDFFAPFYDHGRSEKSIHRRCETRFSIYFHGNNMLPRRSIVESDREHRWPKATIVVPLSGNKENDRSTFHSLDVCPATRCAKILLHTRIERTAVRSRLLLKSGRPEVRFPAGVAISFLPVLDRKFNLLRTSIRSKWIAPRKKHLLPGSFLTSLVRQARSRKRTKARPRFQFGLGFSPYLSLSFSLSTNYGGCCALLHTCRSEAPCTERTVETG